MTKKSKPKPKVTKFRGKAQKATVITIPATSSCIDCFKFSNKEVSYGSAGELGEAELLLELFPKLRKALLKRGDTVVELTARLVERRVWPEEEEEDLFPGYSSFPPYTGHITR